MIIHLKVTLPFEQPFSSFRQRQQMGTSRASALPHKCDVIGISSESTCVFLHPAQHRHLVAETLVAGDFLGVQGQEAEDIQSKNFKYHIVTPGVLAV